MEAVITTEDGAKKTSELSLIDSGDKTYTNGKRKSSIEKDVCTICLSIITERAVAVPCNHLSFDFICLAQWLQNRASCPLCKQDVAEVQYDFRSVDDYKRFVPPSPASKAQSVRVYTLGRSEPIASARPCRERPPEDPALRFRRHIYEHGLYSLHVGSNVLSGYAEYTPAYFASSQEMQSRARAFLRRELRVFDSVGGGAEPASGPGTGRRTRSRSSETQTEYMVEYILAVLRTHSPKAFDGRAEELVAEFVGRDAAKLLLHEIDAWLRSPFKRLDEWDGMVQYPTSNSAIDERA